MRLPRGWHVSPAVKHDLSPALFAWGQAKERAKSHGLKWRVRVRIGHSEIRGRWYGRAYGHKGWGRVVAIVNGELPIAEHHDSRYVNQPGHTLWGNAETLCYLMGHELGHVIGYGGDKAGEMACNAFGWECVKAWRDRQYKEPACLI